MKLYNPQKEHSKKYITILINLMKMHDNYTAIHQLRVAQLGATIAEELKLSPDKIDDIYFGAMIHDIGKLLVSSAILNKPASLDKKEYKDIQQHPLKGLEVIKNEVPSQSIKNIIAQHQERMDGSGYPKGLKGDNISLEARIIAVADVVEAMTFKRPYRGPLGIDVALKEIETNSGKLYDTAVVDACIKLFHKKKFQFPNKKELEELLKE